MAKGYWREVHNRAVREAASAVGFRSWWHLVIAVGVVITIVLVLAFWGSEDAAGDELLARGALVAITVLMFTALYVWRLISTPAKIHGEMLLRIGALERHIAPVLSIYIPTEQGGLVMVPFGHA